MPESKEEPAPQEEQLKPGEHKDGSKLVQNEEGKVVQVIKKKKVTPPKLKAGDYVVQVHLIEARDLKGRGIGDMSDPVVKVTVNGQKQSSKVHKSCLNVVFEEVLVFTFKGLEPGEVESGKITVEIFDANTIRRNVLIGAYEFDMGSVYYMDHHELYRQWVALSDLSDKHEGIQGYLKLSLTVLGPDDEQHIHTAAEEDDDADDMMAVLMPPQIDQQGRLLKVRCYEVDSLPAMDEGYFGGKCDPYPRVDFAGVCEKGKHVTGQTVDVLQEIQIPVMEPIIGSQIRFSIYDWDQAGSDDRIQTVSFDYTEAKEGELKTPKWYNFYGAPQGKSKDLASKMNKGWVEGTFFRGRALLSLEVEDSEEPKKDTCKCPSLLPKEKPATEQYVIQMDIYEGSEIVDKGDMKVEVSCGSNYWCSKSASVEEGRARWYDEIQDQYQSGNLTFTYPADVEQVPDIYIYLRNKKRISYMRIPFADAVAKGWKVAPEWFVLKEDRVLDLLNESEFPGALLFSLRAGRAKDIPAEVFPESRPLNNPGVLMEMAEAKEEETKAPVAEISTVGTLTVTVMEGRDLPIMDRKSSDPYVKLRIGSQKFKTKVIKENLNPKWNEVYEFENVPISAKMEMEVYDEDKIGTDDMMGEATIDLRTEQTKSNSQPGHDFLSDHWFLINDKFPNAMIRLQFRFKYLPLDESKAIEEYALKQAAVTAGAGERMKKGFTAMAKNPLKIGKHLKTMVRSKSDTYGVLGQPEEAQYQLRCHIYQAKKLPASDTSGLCDPYLVVRLAGKTRKTDTKHETLNPQWYKSYSINVTLPVPLSLSPSIQVFVFDWDRMSKDDPLGRFSISALDALNMNKSVRELTPKWFQLRDWDNKPIDDAFILASFQLLDSSDAALPLPDIRPPTVPMFMEVTTLGLRNLQSTLGVHKTLLEFEMPNSKRFKTNKSDKPSSKSPNFLQVLKIPIDIPTSRLYAPAVNLEVKDTLFGGLVKRLIGTGDINLADFMENDDDDVDGDNIYWKGVEKIEILDENKLAAEIREEEERKRREEEERKMKEAAEELLLADARAAAELARQEEEAKRQAEEEEKKKMVKLPSFSERSDDEEKTGQPLLPKDGTEAVSMDSLHKAPQTDGEAGELKIDGEEEKASQDQEFMEEPQHAFSADELLPYSTADDDDECVPKYLVGRSVVDNELEDVIPMNPFITIPLHTGQKNAGRFGEAYREVGKWKGLISLSQSAEENQTDIDNQELLRPQGLFLRVYILRAKHLIPQDNDGKADPYLKIKLGKQKISTRKRYLKNTLEPEFYEAIEMPVSIPGESNLEIEVWDWDGIGDDLIGKTVIDIEDRWFTKSWRKLKLKPVELRTLHSSTSSASQGKLEMWMELLTPKEAKDMPLIDIRPPPPDPYELRVIVWGTRDITIKDEMTGMNDLYVTCQCSVPGLKKQKTDVHNRSKKGLANFNWRMKFPIELPLKDKTWPRLRFQVWDKDYFSANDSICETVISLKGLCKQAMKKKDSVKVMVKNKEEFWLDNLRHPNEEGSQGKMKVSIELVPEFKGAQAPAGFGRSDPNTNPYLPPPEGRFKWSMNPLKLIRDICGEGAYRKVCLGIILSVFCACIYFVGPMVFSQIIAKEI